MMHCKRAREMISERLDGLLGDAEIATLEEHLAQCSTCLEEWRKLQVLDRLLRSAPMVEAPVRVRVQVMARLSRRDQARRALVGGTALALGTIALTLILLAPAILGLMGTMGVAPVIVSGGPETMARLLAVWGTMGRTLMVLLEKFAAPLAMVSLCSLIVALALNSLWIGAVRYVRAR